VLRVVADPGVLVSAVLSATGPPALIVDRWRAGDLDLVVSPKLLLELEEVLLRPRFRAQVGEDDARAYVDALAAEALVVADPEDVERVTRDPDDDYLVAPAIAARADVIVSGDADLTQLVEPPVPVLTPRELLDQLGGHEADDR
jgi:putative PIN family toxin of toxin-antitoxin system